MFILIPLLFILISIAGVIVIVVRKVPYLKKLTPESHEIGGNIFYEFFPELIDSVKNFKYEQYKEAWLTEFEKLLRRLRVVSLKIDRASHALIQKTRDWSAESREANGNGNREVFKTEPLVHTPLVEVKSKMSERESENDGIKKEEQMLIIEIAKNPKSPDLYVKLGNIYSRLGNFQDAKESYETALKLKPDDALIVSKISEISGKIETKNPTSPTVSI